MTLAKISHPKAIGFYFNSPLPPELEALGEGESITTEGALLLCEVAASAAMSAFNCNCDGINDRYYFGNALIDLHPLETPNFPELETLWHLRLDPRGWLEFLAWCQDLASCRLRDSQAQ